MAHALKDWDCRDGEKIYAYTKGAEVLAKHHDAALTAGVIEETKSEGAAKTGSARATGPA